MEITHDSVESFLRGFERKTVSKDMAALLALFADPFLAAMPQGAKVVTAAEYARALPARREFFGRMGCESTSLVSVQHVPLSPRYALAFTRWRWVFGGEHVVPKEVFADTAYIVDTGADPFKIILYLPAEDMMAKLKQNERAAG